MVAERSLDPRDANRVTAVIKCKATRILPALQAEQKKARRGARYEISGNSNKSPREHAGVWEKKIVNPNDVIATKYSTT